jgi:hypothetical protein
MNGEECLEVSAAFGRALVIMMREGEGGRVTDREKREK